MSEKRQTQKAKDTRLGTQEAVASPGRDNRLGSDFARLLRRSSKYLEPPLPGPLLLPRLHTAIFEEACFDERAKFSSATWKKMEQRAQEVAKQLHWSNEQLAMFKQVVVKYRRNPTIENYLRVRREFPQVEIQIAQLSETDSVFALREEFESKGIDPQLLAGCLDADEPSIDALCLRLMELLVEKKKISTDEPGHIQKRRAAISDATVNYLIVTILESVDSAERAVRIPASLAVLIRHLLSGTNPDLHAAYLRKEDLQKIATRAGRMLKPDEKLSINKLASIANIPRIRAGRLLKNEEFKRSLKGARRTPVGKELRR
jgi:hypothetical protein